MADATHRLINRLYSTPMRDVVRGRLTGRLDVNRLIDAANLPEPVAALVHQVVKHTRLWRLEKADVAAELIAHFRDGLDSGREAKDLIATFGEPRKTARLIRRAKKRNRPLIWQSTRCFAWAILILLCVYAAAWVWLITGKPNPSVDYLARMNAAAQAVSEDDRAWTIYREAFLRHDFRNLDHHALHVWREPGKRGLVRPNDETWPEAVALLEARRDLLDAFRRGGAKLGLGFPVGFDWNFQGDDRLALFGPDRQEVEPPGPRKNRAMALGDESLIGILLPNLGFMRWMTDYLAVDLHYAAEQGDTDRAMRDIQALLGMSRQSRENPTLINDLVAHSILKKTLEETAYALERHAGLFSDAQWTDLAHTLASFGDYAKPNLEGERMFMLDTFQRIYSDRGQVTYDGLRFIGALTNVMNDWGHAFQGPAEDAILSVGLPAAAVLMADRDEMQAEYERMWGMLVEDCHHPLWKQIRMPLRTDEQIEAWRDSWHDQVRYWPIVALMPALGRASRLTQSTLALRDAVQVAIALELYHRHHGGYPDTLDALVPRYLPGQPIDHSTGQPLLYRIVNDTPTVALRPGYGWRRRQRCDGEIRGQTLATDPHDPDRGWRLGPSPTTLSPWQ